MSWENIKNQKLYQVIDAAIINKTNDSGDGQRMVLYTDEDGRKFVREHDEFMEKFIKVNTNKQEHEKTRN